MFFPCESVIKKFAPAVKGESARILSSEHSLTQVEIARALGVTQAAVSKHLSRKVGADVVVAGRSSHVKATAARVASGIAASASSGKPSLALIPAESICGFCRELRRQGSVDFAGAKGGLRISSSCDLK